MLDSPRLDHPSSPLQVLDDVFVRVLHVLTHEVRDLLRELAHPVQGTDHLPVLLDDALGQADPVVVLSKVRSLWRM